MRTKAIQDKQTQKKQMSNRFREVVTKKASTAKEPSHAEMDKALKNKLHQNGEGLVPKVYAEKDKPKQVGVIGERTKRQ